MPGRRCQLWLCRACPSNVFVGTHPVSWVATSERPRLILGFKLGAFVAVALAVAAGVAGLLFVTQSMDLPEVVDQLTVENGTDFQLRVEVSDGAGESRVRVGTVEAESTKAFSKVIDQGEVWLFRFHGQGRMGGELMVDRSQLEADGWMLVVPNSVADELRAQGVSPP